MFEKWSAKGIVFVVCNRKWYYECMRGESLVIEVWQMRLMLKRIGTWALLATAIVSKGEAWVSEEQCIKCFIQNSLSG